MELTVATYFVIFQMYMNNNSFHISFNTFLAPLFSIKMIENLPIFKSKYTKTLSLKNVLNMLQPVNQVCFAIMEHFKLCTHPFAEVELKETQNHKCNKTKTVYFGDLRIQRQT